MVSAKLAVALGALYALSGAVVSVLSTLQIPHAGSGVDAPVLIRYVALIVLAYGLALAGTGLAALRWPELGRWVVIAVGIMPFVAVVLRSPSGLMHPGVLAAILPPFAVGAVAWAAR